METQSFRDPLPEELRLVGHLIAIAYDYEPESDWEDGLQVQTMNDGGMGSLRLGYQRLGKGRKLGKVISKMECKDVDGVLLSITLNVDNDGSLFELDIWKIDFSPLVAVPVP